MQSKPARRRLVVSLVSITILALEFYIPRQGHTLESNKTAYIDWLRTENPPPTAIIDLSRLTNISYFLYVQTLHNYPTAFGQPRRSSGYGTDYVEANLLLRRWFESESVHCLLYNRRAYLASLDQLLADGFTHVVVHNWRYGDQFVMPSFHSITPAYNDGLVSVYRLPDLRQSCDSKHIAYKVYQHLAASPSAIPGLRSAIVSFHPSESIDKYLFNYLASLFAEWNSLVHLAIEDGKLTMQSAGKPFDTLGAFAQDNQVIHLLYNKGDTDPDALDGRLPLDDFHLCQQESHEDGSVITLFVKREFDCALVASQQPLSVEYDNGIRLENVLTQTRRDYLDLQLWWGTCLANRILFLCKSLTRRATG